MRLLLLFAALLGVSDVRAQTTAAPMSRVASGVWLLPGGIRPDRQPDGNSVIFAAPAGLIVVDTGRHAWQRDALLAFARTEARPVVAIVNSHWHLDHVSGNPALRAAYPGLKVYASGAIDAALAGFLARSAADAPHYLADASLPAATREDIANDLATIRNGPALRPDVVIAASRSMTIGGRPLRLDLAPDAATAGDVWVYDRRSRVAAVGDLVTLPAPFLDTACPDGWRAALARIATTPFRIVIPGHGAPMTRTRFALYRAAFDSFIDCARSTAPRGQCAANWAGMVQPLLGTDPLASRQARGMAGYYVDLLRANHGNSPSCTVAAAPAR
jgi:glyoxylase-like metal-dependent hydrolase (beta-lactamase superfamily II)